MLEGAKVVVKSSGGKTLFGGEPWMQECVDGGEGNTAKIQRAPIGCEGMGGGGNILI